MQKKHLSSFLDFIATNQMLQNAAEKQKQLRNKWWKQRAKAFYRSLSLSFFYNNENTFLIT